MEHAFFIPILPGKTDAAYAFAEACTARKAEMDIAQVTVTKESWFLQETPVGDFMIIYYHAPDGGKVHESLAASSDPFDVWFKEQVMDVTGVDCNQPMPSLPKQVLNWSR